MKKGIKLCYIHVPAPNKECKKLFTVLHVLIQEILKAEKKINIYTISSIFFEGCAFI